MSKTGIARATGVSVQAARVIVDALIKGGILRKLPKMRGLFGQPSTPIALNRGGAYALGVKIGRRNLEAVLVDMMGDVVREARMRQSAPLPAQARGALCVMVQDLLAERRRARVIGSLASASRCPLICMNGPRKWAAPKARWPGGGILTPRRPCTWPPAFARG
jgi:hypothetical protein